MTKIFLPGLDDVTAEYASKQLGDTTIYAKTYQDFPGKKSDNIRYAEQKRSLMHAGEVRQIAAHKELLIVNDTAPPIKAAYPPMAVLKDKYFSSEYGRPNAIYLGDIDSRYNLSQSSETLLDSNSFKNKKNKNYQSERNDKQTAQIIDEAVSEVIDENLFLSKTATDEINDFDEFLSDNEDIATRINSVTLERFNSSNPSNNSPVILSKTIKSNNEAKSEIDKPDATSDALDGLSDEVRAVQSQIYNQSLTEINRSVI